MQVAFFVQTPPPGQRTADSGQRTADSGQRTADSAVKTMLSLHSLSTFDIETNIGYHHKALVANSNA